MPTKPQTGRHFIVVRVPNACCDYRLLVKCLPDYFAAHSYLAGKQRC